MPYTELINNYKKSENPNLKLLKNNSTNNYINYNYKNNTNNIKIIPKYKSLNNFNSNTFKLLKSTKISDIQNNSLNMNSKPIKIKNNQILDKKIINKTFILKPKTPDQDSYLNNKIQEYDNFKYLYQNQKKNSKNFKNKVRPSTAPHNNNNKKKSKKQDISYNNENEQMYNLYNNYNINKNKNPNIFFIKKHKKSWDFNNMHNKLFKSVGIRPPSPMIAPHLKLIN